MPKNGIKPAERREIRCKLFCFNGRHISGYRVSMDMGVSSDLDMDEEGNVDRQSILTEMDGRNEH